MGKLLLWSNLSVYIGLLISATSRTDTLGQKFSGILIALAINIIMIIRLFLEKRKFKNVAFKTSQLVYITSTLVATFGCIFLVLFGEELEFDVSSLMLIAMMSGLFVLIFSAPVIGIDYLSLKNKKGEYAEKEHIFMPVGEHRNIKKQLCSPCIGIGITLIIVAICVFLIGGVDSLGSGELTSRTCSLCDGTGRRWGGERCSTCDGFGQILYNENGSNIMGTPALWIGIIGIGLVVVGRRLGQDSTSYQTDMNQSDNTCTGITTKNEELAPNVSQKKAKIVEDKWICGNCSTLNSLNYSQCKKCGKYKS